MLNNTQIATEHYNKYNTSYMKTYGSVLQSYMTKNPKEMLAFMGAKMDFKKGDYVLDAGCGFGGPALYYSQSYDIKIKAINIDADQICIANQLKDNNNIKNIDFLLHDFHELYSLSDKSAFDKIFFLESIGHCRNLHSVLKECSKVLSPDGCIFIKTMFSKPSITIEQPNAIKDVRKFYGYTIYNETDFKNIVRKSKFVITEISEFPNMELNLNRVEFFEKLVKYDTPGDMVSNNCELGWKNFSMKYIILRRESYGIS